MTILYCALGGAKVKKMKVKLGIAGLLLLILGVIALLSVFLSWIYLESHGFVFFNVSGWTVFSEGDGHVLNYTFAPLLILVAGIVALVFGLMCILGIKMPCIAFIAVALIGIIALLMTILFYNEIEFRLMGIGSWLAIVMSALITVAGILVTAKILPAE